MKPKFPAFPRHLVVASSVVVAIFMPLTVSAADFVWKGTTDSDWATSTNWLDGTVPAYGSTLTAERLVIGNEAAAGAIYNPGAGVTTTFGSGRGIIIGSPTRGPANLTVTSGTLKINGTGSDNPIMANEVSATLLLNGGNLDISDHPVGFRFHGIAQLGDTSSLTITSGTFSSKGFDFLTGVSLTNPGGSGTVNLDGGTLAVTAFTRTSTSTTTPTTFNLDGGTIRARAASTTFFPDLPGLQTIVEDGGVIIDTAGFSVAFAEVLEHDATLGALPDGGFTKNGVGNLTLQGANTFTGPVTVNAGPDIANPSRILLANNSAAGSGRITLAGSYSEIQLNNNRNVPNNITISDTGAEKTILLPAGSSQLFATLSGDITVDETNADHFRVRSDDSCFLTLSGVVSGPGGIFKYQSGRLNLTNAGNTFTGGIKITHGEVSFVNGGLSTSGRIRMEGTSTVSSVGLRWDPTNNQDVSARIDMFDGKNATFNLAEGGTPFAISNVTFASAIGNNSTATMTKTGPGTLTLTQPSTYSGGTTLTQGILEFSNDGLGTAGTVTMNGTTSSGILRWATGNTQDLSARLAMVSGRYASFSTNGNDVTFASGIGSNSTAGLTKTNSAGTLTLTQANTYSGATTVNGGTLRIGNATSLGVAGPQTTTALGTTVSNGATLDLNGVTGVNELITLNGTGVGGAGALVNNSASPASTGNQMVGFTVAALGSGAVNYSTPPTVAISGTGTGATATALLGLTSASFSATVAGNRSYSVAPTVTISGGGGSGATAVAVLSGGTTGTVTGITVTNAGSGYTTAPTATISGGTSTGTVTATFTGNAANFTVGGLALTNPGSGYTSPPTFTFDGAPATVNTTFSSIVLAANSTIGGSGNTSIAGVVSGGFGLTKVGAGTLTLSATNTYTGGTTINEGSLALGANDIIPNGSNLTVGAATLNAGTFDDTLGTLDVSAAATINLGAGANLVFADSNSADWTGGTLNITGTFVSGSSIKFATSGGLTPAQLALITINGASGTYSLDGSGFLTTGAVVSGFAAWQAANTTSGTLNQDHDQDGVSNGVEWFIGGTSNTTGFNALPGVVNTSGTLSVTWVKAGTFTGTYGTNFVVETSPNLVTPWTPVSLGTGPDRVEISGNNVKYTFPTGTRNFARLKVN